MFLSLDVSGEHAPLLQFEFTRFLSESTRIATKRDTAVTEATTFDAVPVPNLFATADLEDPASAEAGSEAAMKPAVTAARLSSFGMRIAA